MTSVVFNLCPLPEYINYENVVVENQIPGEGGQWQVPGFTAGVPGSSSAPSGVHKKLSIKLILVTRFSLAHHSV